MGRGSVIGLSRERRGARDLHPLCLHSYIKFPIGNHQPDFVVTMEYLNCVFVCLFCWFFMSKLYLCILSWFFCCYELFVLLFLLSRFFSLCNCLGVAILLWNSVPDFVFKRTWTRMVGFHEQNFYDCVANQELINENLQKKVSIKCMQFTDDKFNSHHKLFLFKLKKNWNFSLV